MKTWAWALILVFAAPLFQPTRESRGDSGRSAVSEEFLSRLSKKDWKSYDFPMTRDEWKKLPQPKGSAKPVIEAMSQQLLGGELPQSPALMRFWVRIAPCLDGESAETGSAVFAKWLTEKPAAFLRALIDENRAWTASSSPADSCISKEDVLDSPVLFTPLQLAQQSFPDQELPAPVQAGIKKALAAESAPDVPILRKALLGQ